MFLPLDETSGSVAYDISGCGNNGTHSDGIAAGLLPLIPGGITGTKITNTKYVDCSLSKNYYGENQVVSFGQSGFSDNDFSMEIWIHPHFNTAENLIFGDQVNDIGIFWEKGNLIFKLNSEILEYTVPSYSKSLHVVAVYAVNRMTLFVDGYVVASKPLNNFKFTNTYLNISIGPTASSSSYFIVDAPAVYRYALNEDQVKAHFIAAQKQVLPIHISNPDNGNTYLLSDENTKSILSAIYPGIYSLEKFIIDGLSYDYVTKSLYLTPTDTPLFSEVTFKESISVPFQDSVVRSKISWVGDNGITVHTSIDDSNYVQCINGDQIPQYTNGVQNGNGQLFIKVTFTSSDSSRFNPELRYLGINFYTTNNVYSVTTGEYIEPYNTSSYTLGNINMPVLFRDFRNGLSIKSSNSFKTNTSYNVSSIEMIYTRLSTESSGLLYSNSAGYTESTYSWGPSGNISSSNISKIYVNGIDKTLATNIANVFPINEPYHVFIIFENPISADIIFNYYMATEGSSDARYANLCLYSKAFSGTEVLDHYGLYCGTQVISTSSPAIKVSENNISVNTNDWLVIKSI